MAKRSSQIEEERRSVMATPSPSTPRFLHWTQEDQPAEKTPEGENVELPTFPTPPTPLADTENKMADRPTLFTDKSPSPPETWKTFRFHKQHTTPPQESPKPEKKINKRAIQEIIVSQPIPYWYDHLHAMREMLGRDVPASTLNKGCQTKFMPTTEQEFEVLWDYMTKNDINIVWPPYNRRSEQQPSTPLTPKLKPVSEEIPQPESAKELTASPTPTTTPTTTPTPAQQEPHDCVPSRTLTPQPSEKTSPEASPAPIPQVSAKVTPDGSPTPITVSRVVFNAQTLVYTIPYSLQSVAKMTESCMKLATKHVASSESSTNTVILERLFCDNYIVISMK
ncbi:hypothetical protein ACJJTC_015986 [Scirpophaga incertulas]